MLRPAEASRLSVIVLEHGAQWPDAVRRARERTENAVIVAQLAEESPRELVARVAARLNRAGEGQLEVAVLGTSGRSDPESLEARAAVGALLLGAMPRELGGELVLTASETCGAERRAQLFALAEKLVDAHGDASVFVRLELGATDFTTASRHAGLRSRLPRLGALSRGSTLV